MLFPLIVKKISSILSLQHALLLPYNLYGINTAPHGSMER